MIKISVCDDDEGQLTFFKQCFMEYMKKHKEKIEANFYQSVQSLLNEKKFSPDVYFLDIELQDGNGLKLAGKIRTRNSKIPIVFITSHEEFMPEAFHVHAYQYLNEKKNAQAVENVLNQLADYFSGTKSNIFIPDLWRNDFAGLQGYYLLYIGKTQEYCDCRKR